MLWKRKALCYTLIFSGGFYAVTKNGVINCCENKNQKKKSLENVSYIFIPDKSRDFFNQDTEAHPFSSFNYSSSVSWKLLMLSKSKDHTVRYKSIELLSEMIKLEKWEYMMLAQAIGPSTAVGLARSSRVHKLFFLRPPFTSYKMEDLNEEILNLISSLPCDDIDPCTQMLSKQVKSLAIRISKKVLNSSTEIENCFAIYHSERKKKAAFMFDKLCLQILLCHSTINSHRRVMMEKGILKLLWGISHRQRNNTELLSLVAQILANITLENGFKNSLYVTGWIGTLASWSRSPHVNLSLPAAKALANLDTDDYPHALYDSDIYLLHPLTRQGEKMFYADVIFVHGLRGSTFWTWRQHDSMKKFRTIGAELLNESDVLDQPLTHIQNNKSKVYTFCWPKDWLAVDFPDFRYLSVDYNTVVSNWGSQCRQQIERDNLNTKAKMIIDKLIMANVGERPIIWVTHSMGGILVKQILVEAAASKEKNINLIAKNSKGIIFFSVPHKGSELATLLQSYPYIFQPSVDISQLNKGSTTLLSLHDKFKDIVLLNNIGVLSFGETKKSKWGLRLVSEDSSNPGFGEFLTLPVDHLSTCKPESPLSEIYLKISEFLQQHIPLFVSDASMKCLRFELCNIMSLIP